MRFHDLFDEAIIVAKKQPISTILAERHHPRSFAERIPQACPAEVSVFYTTTIEVPRSLLFRRISLWQIRR
jgi:hypothetical protein